MVDKVKERTCYRQTNMEIIDGLQLSADNTPDRVIKITLSPYRASYSGCPTEVHNNYGIACASTYQPDATDEIVYRVAIGIPGTKRFLDLQRTSDDPQLAFANDQGEIFHHGDMVEYGGKQFAILGFQFGQIRGFRDYSRESIANRISESGVQVVLRATRPENVQYAPNGLPVELTPVGAEEFAKGCPAFPIESCAISGFEFMPLSSLTLVKQPLTLWGIELAPAKALK